MPKNLRTVERPRVRSRPGLRRRSLRRRLAGPFAFEDRLIDEDALAARAGLDAVDPLEDVVELGRQAHVAAGAAAAGRGHQPDPEPLGPDALVLAEDGVLDLGAQLVAALGHARDGLVELGDQT